MSSQKRIRGTCPAPAAKGLPRSQPSAGERLWAEARRGLPAGAAVLAVGVSFGAAARPVIGMLPADVMSVVVFGASSQAATVSTLGAGGVIAAAVAAGLLINLRFLPMCISVGPSLPGGWWRRALAALAVVDASWALARRDDGTFDWLALLGATLPQAVGWWVGTAVGTAAGAAFPAPASLGLDAVFPAFFLALLGEDLRRLPNAAVALTGALIALALTPVLPAGLPVTVAAAAALAGIARPAAQRKQAS